MFITISESNCCPKDVPGTNFPPDPGSKICQRCEYNLETKRNEDRVHDMCPIYIVKCGQPYDTKSDSQT